MDNWLVWTWLDMMVLTYAEARYEHVDVLCRDGLVGCIEGQLCRVGQHARTKVTHGYLDGQGNRPFCVDILKYKAVCLSSGM